MVKARGAALRMVKEGFSQGDSAAEGREEVSKGRSRDRNVLDEGRASVTDLLVNNGLRRSSFILGALCPCLPASNLLGSCIQTSFVLQ